MLIDKPNGLTSHDVVFQIRKIFGVKRVGHCGTLDKPATGLLVAVLGRSARLAQFIQEGTKHYHGTVVFGFTTDTDDATGEVLDRADNCGLTQGAVEASLASFVGDLDQQPPRRSAIKVGGERLYQKVRRGIDFELPVRRVHVDSIDLISFQAENPSHGGYSTAEIKVVCSKGTYIRSIARDLGEMLECGAHLGQLRRTRIGSFRLEQAHSLEALREAAGRGQVEETLLPPDAALGGWPSVTVADELLEYVSHGRRVPVSEFAQGAKGDVIPSGIFAVNGPDGRLIAVVDASEPNIRYLVVLSAN